MSDTVTINVDGKDYEVAAGSNLVDAAKWHAGNDIPGILLSPQDGTGGHVPDVLGRIGHARPRPRFRRSNGQR